jgi:hypothetical protein
MKNSVKKSPKTLFRLLGIAFILLNIPACDLLTIDDPEKADQNQRSQINYESFIVGPDGGTFKALNNNVILNIPKLALDEQVKVVVLEGPIDYDGDFVIKSIEISPKTVVFNSPVSLGLKYNGQLNCGQDPCDARSLVIYHFKNDRVFDKRNYSDMIWTSNCHLNRMDCCIEAEIQSGGIFAVGEESLGQPAIYQQ